MSELTKEKIYKKELEKVGGEGNNNLERIRSLAGAGALEDIKDKNGNLRFVEGEGIPLESTAFETSFARWSLSGTHLMIVLAIKVNADAYVGSNPTNICTFTVPEFIGQKIFRLYTIRNEDVVISKTEKLYNTNGIENQETVFYLKYANNTFTIASKDDLHATSDSYLRLQFDLLIDNE